MKTEEELLRKRIIELDAQIELLEQEKEQMEFKLARDREGND
jgi:hypothetical protein